MSQHNGHGGWNDSYYDDRNHQNWIYGQPPYPTDLRDDFGDAQGEYMQQRPPPPLFFSNNLSRPTYQYDHASDQMSRYSGGHHAPDSSNYWANDGRHSSSSAPTTRDMNSGWSDAVESDVTSQFEARGYPCILYWKCKERFGENQYEEWKQHHRDHFCHLAEEVGYGDMPMQWQCTFPRCELPRNGPYDRFVYISRGNHKEMWEQKIEHMAEHMWNGESVIRAVEPENWMKYYHRMGFCEYRDVPNYNPYPTEPHQNLAMQFRRARNLVRVMHRH